MNHHPLFSTLVLAGGKATRMNGQDKGLVIWQGQPLISHVLKNLPKDDIIISCNRNLELYQQYGRVVSDASPHFIGPLAGIAAALPLCRYEWILITACDMPCLPVGIADYLWQHLDGQKIAVAHDGEHLQPLLLLVHRSLTDDIQQQVSQGFSSVYKWLQRLAHAVVYIEDKNVFMNVNRLEESY
jgi:molybdopterin-guanine dinucleotide biosynthesis protein A